ncbi:MAG: Dephospho-CoA kinase [Syntrophomonadaceae bacterium]|nr:Dephospho-CoA kinase [Bacillota bacterium]
MLILGLTGGIATGKSTVAKMLVELGAAHVDADGLAREVVAVGEPAWQAIVERFGSEIQLQDGSLDRKALASLVFRDIQARHLLNTITHPPIIALARERLAAARAGGALVCVLEAPLLYETGLDRVVDRVVVVAVSEAAQLSRLQARERLTEAEALLRIRAQLPLQEKVRRSDYCIDNDGPLPATRRQVQDLWTKLTGEAACCS